MMVVVEEPTVMVLLRAPPGLAATLYLIVPLPDPVAPEVIVIHGALEIRVPERSAEINER